MKTRALPAVSGSRTLRTRVGVDVNLKVSLLSLQSMPTLVIQFLSSTSSTASLEEIYPGWITLSFPSILSQRGYHK